jgi:hypothetical protein
MNAHTASLTTLAPSATALTDDDLDAVTGGRGGFIEKIADAVFSWAAEKVLDKTAEEIGKAMQPTQQPKGNQPAKGSNTGGSGGGGGSAPGTGGMGGSKS